MSVKNMPGLMMCARAGSFLSITTVTFSRNLKFSQGNNIVDFEYPSIESRLPETIGYLKTGRLAIYFFLTLAVFSVKTEVLFFLPLKPITEPSTL